MGSVNRPESITTRPMMLLSKTPSPQENTCLICLADFGSQSMRATRKDAKPRDANSPQEVAIIVHRIAKRLRHPVHYACQQQWIKKQRRLGRVWCAAGCHTQLTQGNTRLVCPNIRRDLVVAIADGQQDAVAQLLTDSRFVEEDILGAARVACTRSNAQIAQALMGYALRRRFAQAVRALLRHPCIDLVLFRAHHPC